MGGNILKAHKRKKRASILSYYRYNIILSTMLGFVIILLSASICALILTFIDVPIKIVSIFSCICLGIGSYFSGYFSTIKRQKSGILSGSICGFIIFLTITVLGIILNIHIDIIYKLSKFILCIVCGQIGGIKSANCHNA